MDDLHLQRFIGRNTAEGCRAMMAIIQAAENHFDERVASSTGHAGSRMAADKLDAVLQGRAELHRYKSLILAAPRLLFALEQAQAALPDAWAAVKCGVDPELMRLIDIVKAEANGTIPPAPLAATTPAAV